MQKNIILSNCLKSAISGHYQVLKMYKNLKKLEKHPDKYININTGNPIQYEESHSKIFLKDGKYRLAYNCGYLGISYGEQVEPALRFFDNLLKEFDDHQSEKLLKNSIVEFFQKESESFKMNDGGRAARRKRKEERAELLENYLSETESRTSNLKDGSPRDRKHKETSHFNGFDKYLSEKERNEFHQSKEEEDLENGSKTGIVKRKRGRPPKNPEKKAIKDSNLGSDTSSPFEKYLSEKDASSKLKEEEKEGGVKRKRGRPPKNKEKKSEKLEEGEEGRNLKEAATAGPIIRKRGRPKNPEKKKHLHKEEKLQAEKYKFLFGEGYNSESDDDFTCSESESSEKNEENSSESEEEGSSENNSTLDLVNSRKTKLENGKIKKKTKY